MKCHGCNLNAKRNSSSSDMSCRSRLATLNEKLTALERRIEYIEARVSHIALKFKQSGGSLYLNVWKWYGCYINMYLITGDKGRNLDLELIMEIHSIPELPSHPPPWFFGAKCDGFHPPFWGSCGPFLYYMAEFCVVFSWHICIEDMGMLWMSVTQA